MVVRFFYRCSSFHHLMYFRTCFVDIGGTVDHIAPLNVLLINVMLNRLI